MGKHTTISWTDATFNPWWGCEKVSPACARCYAEAFAHRMGHEVWGNEKVAKRRFFGEKHWNEPIHWDRDAAKAGKKIKVFCASMADIFEARPDLDLWREKLWGLIAETPNLIWLLLTKRPENMIEMVPWKDRWPDNVWAGATGEDQKWAEVRWEHLKKVPATVRFLSVEPMLGPLDLSKLDGAAKDLHWVLVGGESGEGARIMEPEWATDLRRQCEAAGIAYHFKQKGKVLALLLKCKDKTGSDPAEWPEEFRLQQFPVAV